MPEDWEEDDGGHLDLYRCDKETVQPVEVVKSLLPQWNTFNFFEVSVKSYHQVREVLSKDKSRVSISGWFHGKPFDRPPEHKEYVAQGVEL